MTRIPEQNKADARELIIGSYLLLKGFAVAWPVSGASRYDLLAERDGRTVRIQVKPLPREQGYRARQGGDIPYRLACSSSDIHGNDIPYRPSEVDLMVGYNIDDSCFAALSVIGFRGFKSAVIHSKTGRNHEYFNSWKAIDEFFE